MPEYSLVDCNAVIAVGVISNCSIAGEVRALEVDLVEIPREHGRGTHGVALGAVDLADRYREPPGPAGGVGSVVVVVIVVAGGRGVAVGVGVSSRLVLRVLPPLSKEPLPAHHTIPSTIRRRRSLAPSRILVNVVNRKNWYQ